MGISTGRVGPILLVFSLLLVIMLLGVFFFLEKRIFVSEYFKNAHFMCHMWIITVKTSDAIKIICLIEANWFGWCISEGQCWYLRYHCSLVLFN